MPVRTLVKDDRIVIVDEASSLEKRLLKEGYQPEGAAKPAPTAAPAPADPSTAPEATGAGKKAPPRR